MLLPIIFMDMISRELFIIDDNADHRYLLEQIFNKYLPQYAVRLFQGGEQLYHYLAETADLDPPAQLPAIIILDLYMPYLGGIQVLKSLKEPDGPYSRYEHIPVIIMTTDATEQQVSDCYKAGANAFVKKPVEFSELKDLLLNICNFWVMVNRIPESRNVL